MIHRVCAADRCGVEFDTAYDHHVYCSETCQHRIYMRTYRTRPVPEPVLPTGEPNCWAWASIVAVLDACEEASVSMLAEAVYGDESEPSRRAMAMMLCDLARDRIYPGGPWLVRIRRGWYRRPGSGVQTATSDALASLLRDRPRTIDNMARVLGIAPRTVMKWISRLRDEGMPIERKFPPRWMRADGLQHVYWIGRRPGKRVVRTEVAA